MLRGLMVAAAVAAWAAATSSAWAIDNPDAPDRIADFTQRAAPFEQRLGATDGGSRAAAEGEAYARFLDAELNRTYQALLAQLDSGPRKALVESQRRWLAFRDAELVFMARQWTRERSGSSATLSLAGHRAALLRARVLSLLAYQAEYADAPRR